MGYRKRSVDKACLEAIDGTFGDDVDYAYGATTGRYSSAECTGIKKNRIIGSPDNKYISTSYVEHQNLTMRNP
jgi:hypothetical protein